MTNTSAYRIMKIAEIVKARKYLEIGVQEGNTFKQLDFELKVGVDPCFRFNFNELINPALELHEETSDEYFKKNTDKKFDIIFLDGLHTFDQTYRDFCNSLKHLNDNGLILIDDTIPTSKIASLSNNIHMRIIRKILNQKHWMGDVYKTIYKINSYFGDLNYVSFENPGQTLVYKVKNKITKIDNSIESSDHIDYDYFMRTHREILKCKPDDFIWDLLKNEYKYQQYF